jgi:hypothetical protein
VPTSSNPRRAAFPFFPVTAAEKALSAARRPQVLTAERHPDADSLYVETIACGDEEPRTVRPAPH